MTNKITPEKTVVNLEIEDIENKYFSKEKNKRGKAFQLLCLSILNNIAYKEISDEDIIDGNDEEGIDIIHLDESENKIILNIFNCKSSLSDNFSANDLTKLQAGLAYIFEKTLPEVQKLNNSKFVDKIITIRNSKEKIIRVNVYYCVYNGSSVSNNVKRKREEIESTYTKIIKDFFNNASFYFNFVDCKKLVEQKRKNEEPLKGVRITIPSFDKNFNPIIETKDGFKGYVASIKADDVAKLVKKYQDSLFEKNVRGWLKYNKKNADIYDSATSDESELFWFMNNGITIIADKIYPNPFDLKWEIENLQIVNGQQTARMLYEAIKNKKLRKNIIVLCRIYETKDPNLINKIAKATNSQSSIGSRDLMSNEPEQIAIEKVFNTLNYYYERQKGQLRPNKKFKKEINSKKLAQISLAVICNKPSLARKNIEDNFFNKEKYYKEIFEHDPKKLLLAYLIFDYCNEQSRNNKSNGDDLKYFGTLHIANIIWNNNINSFNKNLNVQIRNFETGKIDIKKEYTKAYKKLNKIINNIKQQEEVLSLGHYLSRLEVDSLLFKELKK
ncbi:AIPR family protein [Candidatus Wolfebacteria bacterium]|nr:AIPR family protein [Candidatus Wolfebacteria bacterium]